ncbi:MAG: amidoligase family protein [Actinomycetota bacterium]
MNGRLGVEVELLAPEGSSRRVLAEAIADQLCGAVEPFLFPDAEPSKLGGTALFHNLTPGFRIRDGAGAIAAWVVDDITLQLDLDREAPPVEGWWRVVSDDQRLIELAARHVDAALHLPDALARLAELFGVVPEPGPGGMWRLRTRDGQPIAIAAPLPGARHRGAELVTAPIEDDHERRLDELLSIAVGLGFTAPAEGATHVHLDAAPLRHARTFRRFAQLIDPLLGDLRAVLELNPRCVRLGAWPRELLTALDAPDWDGLEWPAVQQRLDGIRITKYCDVNVRNVVLGAPDKDTVELRILPVHVEAAAILRAARLLESIVAWAGGDDEIDVDAGLRSALGTLPLDAADRRWWEERARSAISSSRGTGDAPAS